MVMSYHNYGRIVQHIIRLFLILFQHLFASALVNLRRSWAGGKRGWRCELS